MVDQVRLVRAEVTRVAREVGTEGQLGGQAIVTGVGGTWKDLTDNVNSSGREPDFTRCEHRRGDDGCRYRRPFEEDHRGRERRNPRTEDTINTMVDQFNGFACEVTRVAREVGTEGRLGGSGRSTRSIRDAGRT